MFSTISKTEVIGNTEFVVCKCFLFCLGQDFVLCKEIKKTVGRGGNAGNMYFLLSPQCFLSNQRQKSSFKSHLCCHIYAFNFKCFLCKRVQKWYHLIKFKSFPNRQKLTSPCVPIECNINKSCNWRGSKCSPGSCHSPCSTITQSIDTNQFGYTSALCLKCYCRRHHFIL